MLEFGSVWIFQIEKKTFVLYRNEYVINYQRIGISNRDPVHKIYRTVVAEPIQLFFVLIRTD